MATKTKTCEPIDRRPAYESLPRLKKVMALPRVSQLKTEQMRHAEMMYRVLYQIADGVTDAQALARAAIAKIDGEPTL